VPNPEALANGPTDFLLYQTTAPGHLLPIRDRVLHRKKGPGQNHLPEPIARMLAHSNIASIHLLTGLETMSGFFEKAQPRVAPEYALSVSVVTNTTSASAKLQNCGMARRANREETSRDVSSAARVLPSVSTGNYHKDVCQHPTSKTTNAQNVENLITVPNCAFAERETKPITTYKHAAWSAELSKHDLVRKYPDLVEGIIHGFNLGINTVSQTYSPFNHMSTTIYCDAYLENVNKEFQSG